MSPRKAKRDKLPQPQAAPPAVKPISELSERLNRAVAQWQASRARDPQLAAAITALANELIGLGGQDGSMLLDRHAIRTARRRVTVADNDAYSQEDMNRAASVFSSSIISAVTSPS